MMVVMVMVMVVMMMMMVIMVRVMVVMMRMMMIMMMVVIGKNLLGARMQLCPDLKTLKFPGFS